MLETLRKDNADAQNVNADGDRKVVGSDAIGSCTKFDNFFLTRGRKHSNRQPGARFLNTSMFQRGSGSEVF